jgi:hypothetical protein
MTLWHTLEEVPNEIDILAEIEEAECECHFCGDEADATGCPVHEINRFAGAQTEPSRADASADSTDGPGKDWRDGFRDGAPF